MKLTVASFKRWHWPRLVRKAEKSMRLKFTRRPVLIVEKRRGNLKAGGSSELRPHKRNPHVYLTKKLIREDPKLAQVAALHELRTILAEERGYTARQAHRRARSFEEGDGRRLGFKRRVAWRLREFLGYRKGDGIRAI